MIWRKSCRQWRLKDCSGAVAVEFALVLPVMVVFMLGIIEWGRYMYTYNTMQFGCEQAVRWGVYHITGTSAAVEDYARNQMTGVVPDNVTVVMNAGTTSVEVSANTQFNFITSLVTPFPSITITARAKM